MVRQVAVIDPEYELFPDFDEDLRAGMIEEHKEFREAARKGFCTMEPNVDKWVRICFGKDTSEKNLVENIMGVKELVQMLMPDRAGNLLKKHHNALADAEMHLAFFAGLCQLAEKNA